MKSTS